MRSALSGRTSTHRTAGLFGRGVATLALGAVAVGGLQAFAGGSLDAAAHSAATLAPGALSAMADRTGLTSRDVRRPEAAQALAQLRTATLAEAADDLAAARQDAALTSRKSSLTGVAQKIAAESVVLRDKSTFFRPTAGGVGSPFGMRRHPILGYLKLHNGDDIGGRCGQPIWAATDGVVTKADTGGFNGGSGNNVRLDAGKVGGVKLETAYLHMNSIVVSTGDTVHKGQLLGTVGNTGLSTACHLHFSVYEDGKAVDPGKYLKV